MNNLFDFRLPLESRRMRNSFIEFLDFKNTGIAVEIVQLCCVHAEIQVFTLVRLHLVFLTSLASNHT